MKYYERLLLAFMFCIHLLFCVDTDAHCFQDHFALLFVSKTFNLINDAEENFSE